MRGADSKNIPKETSVAANSEPAALLKTASPQFMDIMRGTLPSKRLHLNTVTNILMKH
jgi:hypothetical protein